MQFYAMESLKAIEICSKRLVKIGKKGEQVEYPIVIDERKVLSE